MPREAGLTGLAIRRAEASDYEAFRDTFADESAYSGTLQLPFPSAEVWKKRLEGNGPDDYVLLALVDGKPAGNAGMHAPQGSPRRAHVRHVGITVGTHKAYALRAGRWADAYSMARIRFKPTA